MSRVVITGGAGYVGGWLTDRVIEAGHDVRVYDLLLYEDRYLKDVPFIAGDVLDYERLRPHLEWADTVVWLAGLVGDPACGLDPSLTNKINLESVEWLCDNFAERILTERRPNSLILRLATLAGLGDTYSRIRLDLVVNLLVVRARLVGELEVFGGNQFRPLLHVRDGATAVVPHLDSGVSGIFNLGTENLTIRELAERVVQRVGGARIRVVDVPFQDTRNYRVSFERARRELEFVAEHPIDEAIDEIAELIDAGRVKDLSMAQFSNFESLRPYLQPDAIPLGHEGAKPPRLARPPSPTA